MFGSKAKSETVADAGVIEVVDAVGNGDAKPRRGGVVGLITLPFRLVAAAVRATVAVIVLVGSVLLFPFKVAWAITSRIVRLAADVVYGIWRFFLGILAAIAAVLRFIWKVIDRTVGALIRLVFRVLRGIITLPLRAFKIGTKVGAAEATVKTAASAAGASATAKLADVKAAPAKVRRFRKAA